MAVPNDEERKSGDNPLDLSELSSMSLGPDWVSGNKPRPQVPEETKEYRGPGPRGPRKDRRGALPRKRASRGGHTPGRGEERPQREERFFKPVVEVIFYPEEEPFRVLSQAIKTSCRTFELFEIARLILEKPDRYVCVVRDPEQKEGEPAKLYASVPDGLPFRSEEEALEHALRHYLEEFFEKETVEVEPPKGVFQQIHKCGFTGELLGPPNYHRYQALCREHHAAKLAHMPYSRFEQRIEASREEEDIQAWLEKMKAQTHYKSKETPELVLTNFEDARLHLITQYREKLVRPAYSARFSGRALALLNPGDPIRRSVEAVLDQQRKFPLDTANHLRGRLRRMHFAVYKRGSKGISFVCAVKRRFRKPDEVLADNLQELIDFLEAHPNFPAKDLPKAYLGIRPQAEKKPDAERAAEEVAREVADDLKQTSVDATSEETAKAEEAPPQTPVPQENGPDDAQKQAIAQLKTDLRYLVSEGYVIEYSDGRLFVPPIREEEIRRVEKTKQEGGDKADPPKAETSEVEGTGGAPAESAASPEPEEAETGADAEPATESTASAEPDATRAEAEAVVEKEAGKDGDEMANEKPQSESDGQPDPAAPETEPPVESDEKKRPDGSAD